MKLLALLLLVFSQLSSAEKLKDYAYEKCSPTKGNPTPLELIQRGPESPTNSQDFKIFIGHDYDEFLLEHATHFIKERSLKSECLSTPVFREGNNIWIVTYQAPQKIVVSVFGIKEKKVITSKVFTAGHNIDFNQGMVSYQEMKVLPTKRPMSKIKYKGINILANEDQMILSYQISLSGSDLQKKVDLERTFNTFQHKSFFKDSKQFQTLFDLDKTKPSKLIVFYELTGKRPVCIGSLNNGLISETEKYKGVLCNW